MVAEHLGGNRLHVGEGGIAEGHGVHAVGHGGGDRQGRLLGHGEVPLVGPVGDLPRAVDEGELEVPLPRKGLARHRDPPRVGQDLRGGPDTRGQTGEDRGKEKQLFRFHELGCIKIGFSRMPAPRSVALCEYISIFKDYSNCWLKLVSHEDAKARTMEEEKISSRGLCPVRVYFHFQRLFKLLVKIGFHGDGGTKFFPSWQSVRSGCVAALLAMTERERLRGMTG